MKTRTLAIAMLTVAAGFACGGDTPAGVPPPPPVPPGAPPPAPPPPPGQPGGSGTLTVSLTTPNADDAALLLELRGANIHGIALTNSAWRMYADSSGSPIRIVVAGHLAAGPVLTFQVPDVDMVASYTATLVDVSNAQNELRAKTGYALVVTR
jgi:hypothetical protein